jgi:hypothetical protein
VVVEEPFGGCNQDKIGMGSPINAFFVVVVSDGLEVVCVSKNGKKSNSLLGAFANIWENF